MFATVAHWRLSLWKVMFVDLRRFVAVEKKTFKVVAEGRGARIFENGRGFWKSIFFQKEDVEWLLKSFREFIWEKGEVVWGTSCQNSWRTLWMALSKNKNGEFLVFSEGKEGPKGIVNKLFLPEGVKAEGWW